MSFGSVLRERRTELSIGLTDMAEREADIGQLPLNTGQVA